MRVAKPFSLASCWSLAIMESTGPLSPAACVWTSATRSPAACASSGASAAVRPSTAAAPSLRTSRREGSFNARFDRSKDLLTILSLHYGAPDRRASENNAQWRRIRPAPCRRLVKMARWLHDHHILSEHGLERPDFVDE